MHRPVCIIFMSMWPAKVDQDAIPQVLGDMALILPDDL